MKISGFNSRIIKLIIIRSNIIALIFNFYKIIYLIIRIKKPTLPNSKAGFSILDS